MNNIDQDLIEECIGEVGLRRHAQRGTDGKMVADPNSFYHQLGAYFDTYGMGRTDHLSERFQRPIPVIRAAMQNVRGIEGRNISTLEQPQGGHGLYYRDDANTKGLLIRNPDTLRAARVPKDLLLPFEARQRVSVMLNLGVVNPNSMTAEVLQRIAESPVITRDLARAVGNPRLNIANVINERVHRKLPLFGLSLQRQPAGKFGLANVQAYSLQADEVKWDWDEVYLDCDEKIEKLFRDNWSQFLGYALRLFRREEEAHDVVQNVFTSFLFRARREPREMLGRLHKSFVFEAIKKKRTESVRTGYKRGDHLSIDGTFEESYQLGDYATQTPTPAFILEVYDTRNQLLAALSDADVSDDERAVINLHYMEGLASKDVAAKVGCSLRTVQNRLNRARTTLKTTLGKKFFM